MNEKPSAEELKKITRKGNIIVVLVLFALGAASLYSWWFSKPPGERRSESASESRLRRHGVPTADQARYAAREFVKQRLKAPSSASFLKDTATVIEGGPTTYRYNVSGSVDAKNPFGANIRTPYSCVVMKKAGGDAWYCEGLTLSRR